MTNLPSLDQMLADNIEWLLTAVTTEEAANLLSIPSPTLVTWRSRKSDGPPFVRNPHCRIVRYLRIELYRWLLADGLLDHNGSPGRHVAIPLAPLAGKHVGSTGAPARTRPGDLPQGVPAEEATGRPSTGNPPQPPARSGLSNSPGRVRGGRSLQR